jgi:hypothetical protein
MDPGVDAKLRGRCLWRYDTSNTPLEWTGRHQLPSLIQVPCLPLKSSVGKMETAGPH